MDRSGDRREESAEPTAAKTGTPESATAFRIDPVKEDLHWQRTFRSEPYCQPDDSYDDFGPAYRLGIAYRLGSEDSRTWKDSEPALQALWQRRKGFSRLDWDRARDPVCAAWNRIDTQLVWPPERAG